MTTTLHVVLIVAEVVVAVVATERAARAIGYAKDSRYEAEYAKRCADKAKAAARYQRAAVEHLAAHHGIPVPPSLRAAWDATGLERRAYGAAAEGDPQTPA